MYLNPLAAPLLNLLQEARAWGVHELMEALQSTGVTIPTQAEEPQLVLFQKNFMLMNALFELQRSLRLDGWYLHVSTLDIHLAPQPGPTDLPVSGSTLSDYYLDWSNIHIASAEVDALLDAFWHRYTGLSQRDQALHALGLEQDSDWETVRARYRKLAAEHHPDRGGEQSRFVEIRAAYEQLRMHMAIGRAAPPLSSATE